MTPEHAPMDWIITFSPNAFFLLAAPETPTAMMAIGTGKYPGHFKKSITLRTNAKTEMVRLYIEGDMTPKDEKKDEK